MISSFFVFVYDNTPQSLILLGLYNVNYIVFAYHILSAFNSISFKFGVEIGVALGYEKGGFFAPPIHFVTALLSPVTTQGTCPQAGTDKGC